MPITQMSMYYQMCNCILKQLMTLQYMSKYEVLFFTSINANSNSTC